MPRFRIHEIRARNNYYILEAADMDAACQGDGDVIEESLDADDWTERTVSVEEIGDDD